MSVVNGNLGVSGTRPSLPSACLLAFFVWEGVPFLGVTCPHHCSQCLKSLHVFSPVNSAGQYRGRVLSKVDYRKTMQFISPPVFTVQDCYLWVPLGR